MNLDFSSDGKLQSNRFGKLWLWYVLALSMIATVAIVGQVLIQNHLQSQLNDSHVVNLAGAQRYKSQSIVKMSVLLYAEVDHQHFPDKIERLQSFLSEFETSHKGLQHGNANLKLPGKNSAEVMRLFAELDPYYHRLSTSAKEIIRLKQEGQPDNAQLERAVKTLLDSEYRFLEKMDQIVLQYDQEAKEKVNKLSKLEYFLLAISILVIALEIVFVFRPTTLQINQTINQLTSSENNAKKLSKEIGALYASLEKSYEQLSIVNQPVENPRLFAKGDKGGNITSVTDLVQRLSGHVRTSELSTFADLFPGMSSPDDWMDNVIETVSDGDTWIGEIRFEGADKKDCWVHVIITPVFDEYNNVDELVMMGTDITERKGAEQNMNVKNRAEIEKKINQQKFRSVLILEGQEEERKRIAMDIHDGIGQMLTSLKFQIESIDLKRGDAAVQKIKEIELLIKDVIREVRRVTFNLKPTVLGDFGLQAALNVFVKEISKLTDINLAYKSTGEVDRLPQKIENNIFRIIQEAINNAIKYSQATAISIDLAQTVNELQIMVKDNGKGFDAKSVQSRNTNIESGRGFFNMHERTDYINGKLKIDSQPGAGTTITLSVPVSSTVAVD